jgi:myosin-5
VLSLWLANVCALLTCLKQFSGDEYFGILDESLKSFDLFEYRQIFNDAIVHLNHNFLRLCEEKIQPLIVPAILEYEGLASSGICSQPSNLHRSGSISSEPDGMSSPIEKPVNIMINELSELYKCLLLHDNQPEMIFQIFKQLFFFICAGALNNLLLRKDLCHWNKVSFIFIDLIMCHFKINSFFVFQLRIGNANTI